MKVTRLLILTAFLWIATNTYAQTIRGVIKSSESGDGIPAASVVLKSDETKGTMANESGEFEYTVASLPVTLKISSVNYEPQEITVTSTAFLTVSLIPLMGREVVVSASRFGERSLESPVTIERVSAAAIKNTPAASYYDVISKLKGWMWLMPR